MKKRMLLMLIVVGLVLGGVFGYKWFAGQMMKKYMAAAGAPVATVSTVKAAAEDWQPKLTAVGTLRAVEGTDVSPEVAGIVEQVDFQSGAEVAAGAALVQLRAEDDIAKLQSLQASSKLAQVTYARDLKEVRVHAISQATLDADTANLHNLKAQVAEQAAIVAKKTVRAPFAGQLGIRQVDVGQYLNPGAAVVTLQELDPIYCDFDVPEQDLAHVADGQKVTLTTDARAGKSFEGQITSINAAVDVATRNVQVRATLKNPDRLLMPGMFARVTIASGKAYAAVTVPQTTITYNPYGDTVYLAVPGPDGKGLVAHQTFVTVGATRGDQVQVLTGVKAGDTVVTAGQVKLRNGAPIKVDNSVVPTNNPNPKPEDE
ncbi:MAG TPA: efflux RND transporter periplasmic adaptor subunit [Alphaproteobacteria bacterium]|nr:efflux RND transporter periplasmic adaptor subunit [Alphaproteobacteria bacterium]